MKFAFLIFKYFPFGGVQRDMLRIAQACVDKGHEVAIYTGKWQGDLPDKRIHVHVLKQKGILNHHKHQSLIRAMFETLLLEKPNLVVGFNRIPNLDVYYAADPCFIDRAHRERTWFYRLTGRYRFFSQCERSVFGVDSNCNILLLTPRDKSIFQDWYHTPDSRFHDIPPYIPSNRFKGIERPDARRIIRKEFGLPVDSLVVIHVGSAYLRKGLDRVIHGVANLPEKLKEKVWILAIGEDDAGPMQRLANKLNVSERLIIAGGRNDVAMLMMGSDMLAHPARSELAGLVIIEAMTAGIPVIVTSVCGYAQHVTQARAGVALQEPYSQAEFDYSMHQALSTDTGAAWGLAGQQYVEKLMSQNSQTYEADLLDSLAKEKVN